MLQHFVSIHCKNQDNFSYNNKSKASCSWCLLFWRIHQMDQSHETEAGDITKKCSINSFLRSVQVHHHLQLGFQIGRKRRNPKEKFHAFWHDLKQFTEPGWYLRRFCYKLSIGIKVPVLKDFSIAASVINKVVLSFLICFYFVDSEEYAISEI